MRPSKTEYFMGIAEAVSLASHDSETKVGGILVKNKDSAIIATGFNGFIKGAPDHKLPTTRPDKYLVILHSEENLIAHCSRHGISSVDTTLYITMSPCVRCARLLYNAGINNVVFRDKYRDFETLLNLPDLEVKQIETNTLIFSPRK